MKILLVGDWRYEIYEKAMSVALRKFNINIISLKTFKFKKDFLWKYRAALPFFDFYKSKLNKKIIKKAKYHKPNFVLFWRPTHILPKTILQLSKMNIKTISYNNDDPFGPKIHKIAPWHHHFLWYYYLKCLPFFDFNFFYRKINCIESKAEGARHADLLLPYFIPSRDRYIKLTAKEKKKFQTDIVFIGHYEPDGRENLINELINENYNLKLWGGKYWTQKILGKNYKKLLPIKEVSGDDYIKALCGAKICLAFLSKLNRDNYTRRCFEIPACGKVMLAERTKELTKLFKEDVEACFFSSKKELLIKVNWLLKNPKIRKSIGNAGKARVWKDGHDINSRANEFIKKLKL